MKINIHLNILRAVRRAGERVHIGIPVKGMTATTVRSTPSGGWAMYYHRTPVALFGGGDFEHVSLFTDGHYTATTARRINQALYASGRPGWRVSRRKGVYVLRTSFWTVEFRNEVLIDRHTQVVHAN